MITEVYKQWKAERGDSYLVQLLDFVEYHKTSHGYDNIFKEDGIKYVGEIYNCINLETGVKETCIIKTEYLPSDDIGWSYNKAENQPIDTWVNPLVDEYEDWQMYINSSPGRIVPRHPNRELLAEIAKDKIKVKKLQALIANESIPKKYIQLLKLKLKFITSPDRSVSNQWKNIPKEIKLKLNDLDI